MHTCLKDTSPCSTILVLPYNTKMSLREGYRCKRLSHATLLPDPPHDLFPAFLDLLRNVAQPVLSALPDSPPVCVVGRLHGLLEDSVPPIFGHLCQPNGHFARPGLSLWLLGLVEVCEDAALLAQKRSLCCAVLCVQGDREIEDGGGKCEASELL